MTELLAGGGLGVILASLGMGFLLWREVSKRRTAELAQRDLVQKLVNSEAAEQVARNQTKVLRTLLDQREKELDELESHMSGAELFDHAFGGVQPQPSGGQPDPKK